MEDRIIESIEAAMQPVLSADQQQMLRITLQKYLKPEESATADDVNDESTLVRSFLAAKRVEGCSDKTVRYYDSTIRNVLKAIGKDAKDIQTDDLRLYLDEYQTKSGVSKVTIDNIRRILSSFFSWLEDEDYIAKSPVRRIHKVKTCKTVKETYSDEALECCAAN